MTLPPNPPQKVPYTKPALTLAQQIAKLESVGMTVADHALAQRCLQHISYYRLSAYWLYFEHPKGHAGPRFKAGTTFEDVVALYEFDRGLRLLVLDAIERIEVAIRGSWAYVLAMKAGSHGYLDGHHYSDGHKFAGNCQKLDEETERSKDTFIIHYKAKYSGPKRPPVWMASELMSFGLLSRWYALLKEPKDRQAVATPFGLDEVVFVPAVQQISNIRNTCAHHGRLWNRSLKATLKLPKRNPPDLANALNRAANDRLYNSLAFLKHLLDHADPGHNWGQRLIDHIATLQVGTEADMGFPPNWQNWKLWGGTQ
jgi:abortive infection bacteriophage resistance protein